MTTFHDLGLAEPVLKAVLAEGYETPTPIQQKSIPVMLTGRDVLGIAQTGTGKTAAFVLPQLDRLARDRTPSRPKTARVLVLAPTRELAAQIADSVHAYGKALKPSVAVVIGGVKAGPQVRAMARGVDFLIATPGRLLDLMDEGAITLEGVKTVVLDEADQMLDLGFFPAIRRIMGKAPKKRQTLLFSATMPAQIRSLADDFLTDPLEVAVTPASKPIERIEQQVVFLEKAGKPRLLARMLKDAAMERAVVFTRTKHGANKLCQLLERAGVMAQAIHGNKSQNQREKTLAAFRDGSLKILVATDIAARGIDIDDVSHVFNYELPNVPEVYVHRIGRTARAGRSGHAVAFCDASERVLLRDIEKLTGMKIPVLETDLSDAAPIPAAPRGEDRASTTNRKPQQVARKPGGERRRGDAPRADTGEEGATRRRKRRRGGKPAGAPGEARNAQQARSGEARNAKPSGQGRNAAKPGEQRADGAAPQGKGRKRRRGGASGGNPGGKAPSFGQPVSGDRGERKPAANGNDAGLKRMLGA
ncbi:MAG: DEAD/DEAH box helicase [Notoacmeibacter sp.]|nr:DEAD/DEAH box helicase [Notoacmeibacter sp.]MCC0032938.1 DEAD/DEAH box helicase [Brucellaceae bacterium]